MKRKVLFKILNLKCSLHGPVVWTATKSKQLEVLPIDCYSLVNIFEVSRWNSK